MAVAHGKLAPSSYGGWYAAHEAASLGVLVLVRSQVSTGILRSFAELKDEFGVKSDTRATN